MADIREILDGVDIDKGMANCGGTMSDYLDILEISQEYGPRQLEELCAFYSDGDYESYTIRIHAMKSTSRNMGADDIADMAMRLEQAGKAGDYDYIDEHSDEFAHAYATLMDKVDAALKSAARGNADAAQPEGEGEARAESGPSWSRYGSHVTPEDELDDEMVTLTLQNIRNCVDHFEFTKVFSILDELGYCRLSDAKREMFAKIREDMDVLDVDDLHRYLDEQIGDVED